MELLLEKFWTAANTNEQSSYVLEEYDNYCELVNSSRTVRAVSGSAGRVRDTRENNELSVSRCICYSSGIEKHNVINWTWWWGTRDTAGNGDPEHPIRTNEKPYKEDKCNTVTDSERSEGGVIVSVFHEHPQRSMKDQLSQHQCSSHYEVHRNWIISADSQINRSCGWK